MLLFKILDKLGIVNVVYYSGKKPYRKYSGDAGCDLYVSKTTIIRPKTEVDVPVRTVITSPSCWFLLINRSSTFKKKKLLVMTSVIDNGYTGHMDTCVYNPTNKTIIVEEGERVSQVVPFRMKPIILINGLHIKKNGRGNRGFGSTGK